MEEEQEHLPLQKLTIPGPTLAALLHLVSSSSSSSSGLLFGHLSSHLTPLSDSTPSSSSRSSSLVATITSFQSNHSTSSSSSSCGSGSHHHHLIGFFSSRRRSPLRLSLNDFSLSLSLKINPCIFLLLTTPLDSPQTLIDTFEFKAFQFRVSARSSFETIPMEIVNIGPAFRADYASFSVNSRFPRLAVEEGERMGSPMREDDGATTTLREMKRVKEDQKGLDLYAEGFDVGELGRLMRAPTSGVTGLEELYGKMLVKLGGLAREVERSSEKVLEQENRNNELRYKVLGLGA